MKIRQRVFALLLWGASSAAVHDGYSRPVDLSAPSNSIGAANLRGCLEKWTEVDEIDLGDGLVLPLRFKFSSEKGVRGLFGEGFWCPLIEAHSVLVRPLMMKVNLLCGKTLYLRRDRKDKNRFQTLDQEWTGILDGGKFRISRDDGWELEFLDGRLVSLTTDTGRKLRWTFNGTQPTGIQEGARTVLKVETQADEISIYSGVRRHTIALSKRPNFSIVKNQVVVEGFSPCLSSWRLPDQKTEQFTFALTEDQAPKLTVVDRGQNQTIFTWDAATGHIRTESDWTYQVTPVPERFGLPKIMRSTVDGKKEGLSIDNDLGIYTKQNLDGTETVTYTVKSPGPNYGKTLKSLRRDGGSETVLYTASYDDLGRLHQSVDEKGFTTTYNFNADGQFIGRTVAGPTDGNLLKKLAMRENALLESVATAKTETLRGDALQALGFFYIHQAGNPQKALDLLNQVTSRQQRFNLIFHAIDNQGNFSGRRKAEEFAKLLTEFPEQRELLEILIKTRKEADGHLERVMHKAIPTSKETKNK